MFGVLISLSFLVLPFAFGLSSDFSSRVLQQDVSLRKSLARTVRLTGMDKGTLCKTWRAGSPFQVSVQLRAKRGTRPPRFLCSFQTLSQGRNPSGLPVCRPVVT